jgi:hypothetical protein
MKKIWYSQECDSESLPKLEENFKYATASYIYLHGELEYAVGYDIIHIPIEEGLWENNYLNYKQHRDDKLYAEEYRKLLGIEYGEYPVTIKANGETYDAIARVWPCDSGMKDMTGLVCLVDDERANTYAKQMHAQKSVHL